MKTSIWLLTTALVLMTLAVCASQMTISYQRQQITDANALNAECVAHIQQQNDFMKKTAIEIRALVGR